MCAVKYISTIEKKQTFFDKRVHNEYDTKTIKLLASYFDLACFWY